MVATFLFHQRFHEGYFGHCLTMRCGGYSSSFNSKRSNSKNLLVACVLLQNRQDTPVIFIEILQSWYWTEKRFYVYVFLTSIFQVLFKIPAHLILQCDILATCLHAATYRRRMQVVTVRKYIFYGGHGLRIFFERERAKMVTELYIIFQSCSLFKDCVKQGRWIWKNSPD